MEQESHEQEQIPSKESQIFGIRAIIEAIRNKQEVDKVFIQKDAQGTLMRDLLGTLKKHNINFSYVPVEKLNRMTKLNHQGAIASISPVKFYDMETLVTEVTESGKTPLFLILDQLSDARNFGAIIRTAECTGVNGIIVQKAGSAPVNGDTVKTSAGAVFNVPICKVEHIKDAIFYLQGSGIKTVAATEKTESALYDVNFTDPVAIIMGSEERGINPSVLKIVDEKAKLPMFGTIGSLNVSVACGAFLYEAVRQRSL
ncbi:23S rRNA (guanosine(2251)-2'-O)-methyltransferase RlmB [Flavobacterium sp.]|uniref:23S rRNA (guanosine(2251)-2'-O)-methyltransferase RlmB n=1 Tax=Flavobacterium sp. TaxID=239 RepID=UPI0012152E04|nr:23S rRNA (guanosine(2251)-2'-O)-methyltransferase RlmB [Flavobacterium sp.]RZJ70018.1 MAG: 23S rRNA (guanosine(2251)-2'-O)-methyltransferase RlmB [Flavobacterium sp.]